MAPDRTLPPNPLRPLQPPPCPSGCAQRALAPLLTLPAASVFPGFLLPPARTPDLISCVAFVDVCLPCCGPATSSAGAEPVCVGGTEEPRGTKGLVLSAGGGQCLGGTSGVCPGIYKGEAGVPCSTLRAQGGPGPKKVGSAAAAEPWAGWETGRLGRTRTVLPKHLAVGLTRRGRPFWIRSLSCGAGFQMCLHTGEGGVGDHQGPAGKRSSDTTAAGETSLGGVPAHPPPALLVSRILPHRGLQLGPHPVLKTC